jgi:hypothetical protein
LHLEGKYEEFESSRRQGDSRFRHGFLSIV